jgi:preprotein translocase subunit SecD
MRAELRLGLYAALVGLGVLALAVYVYYRRGLRRWKL